MQIWQLTISQPTNWLTERTRNRPLAFYPLWDCKMSINNRAVPMAWWMQFHSCLYRRANGSSPSAWSKGRQPSGAVLHSSCEPGELSQWLSLSHDDSTINIVLVLLLLLLLFLIALCYWAAVGRSYTTCNASV